MKKLASLLAVLSLGLFAVGCNDADVETVDPVPGDTTDMGDGDTGLGAEGGSSYGEDMEIVDDAPPITDDAPPAFTPEPVAPETEDTPTLEPTPETDPSLETETPTLEESAENESAIEAAESADSAEPAPADEETAPE